ncbi:MAG: hypothetical protein QCI00_05745, partial [Candidatus Thermoplasmatota archaeon]|nr:hypothetical protein [Candidatus Thermoplasmatota archaeon]
MMSSNYRKKIIPLFGSILVVLMLLSTVTAVPQQHASVLNDQLTKKQQLETFFSVINEQEKNEQGSLIYTGFLLNIADVMLYQLQKDTDSVELTETMIFDAIPDPNEPLNAEKIMIQAENTLITIQSVIDDLNDPLETEESMMNIPGLQTLISLLIQFIRNRIGNGNGLPIGNGNLLSILKTIFSVLGSILVFIMQALLQGISLLIGGIIKVIVALVTIVLIILAGLQTILTIGAFFLIFIGFMSNIGLKALFTIASPIFALLSAQLSISIGKLVGGLSMALFSILGFMVFFALPLLLILGLVL